MEDKLDKETSMNRKNKGSKDFYKSSSKGGGNSRKKMTVGVALAVLSAAAISVPVIIHYNKTKGFKSFKYLSKCIQWLHEFERSYN